TPIVTPASVKKLLSFCTRIWARASLTASSRGMRLRCHPERSEGSACAASVQSDPSVATLSRDDSDSFIPQRLDRIQPRRANRGQHAEHNAGERAADEGSDDRDWRRR